MNTRGALAIVAAVLVMGGCSPSADVPATTPTTTTSAPAEQTATSSTTVPTATTTVTETTTTVDRLVEITAVFEDLERRRLAAIYSGDVEAFSELFADTPYLERSLEVFDIIEPGEPPQIEIEVLEILRDDDECLAIFYGATDGGTGERAAEATAVLYPVNEHAVYAYTSEGKGGWLCDGPHPLE